MKNRTINRKISAKGMVMRGAAAAALLILVILASGCGNPLLNFFGGDDQATGTGDVQEIETGLRLTIPRFSSWLQGAFGETEPADTSSRAIAVADSFTVIVRDNSDTVVHDQDYTGGIAESQTCSISLAPASGYSVEVLVYNEDVSMTEAVVIGTAEGITITEGETTALTVNCIPVSPEAAILDTPMTITDIVTSTWTGFYEVDNPGGEFWFSFTAPASGHVRFVPDFSGYSFLYVIGIYDETGAPVKSFQSRVPTYDPLKAETVLTAGATYYGVFLPLSAIEGGSQGTVSGNLTLEAFDAGDCGYTGADAVSVSGTLDFSALTGAGYAVSSINIQVHPPDGSATGIMNIDSGDFTGNTADYTLYNMDPTLEYSIYFQPEVDSGSGPEFVYYDPVTPDLSGGDVTGYDYVFSTDPFAPPLTLEDTRVNVTVNFEYTGSAGPVDCQGAVILTYSDGGPAFAGQSFYYSDFGTDFAGSVTFDDPLVPVGEEVYAQIYFDADWSFSLTAGDPYYKHPTPISVDGGSVIVSFDDTETCSASCPDAAGGWQTADYIITLDENTFAILARTDGSPTYADLADTNRYGIITTVDNAGGYVIGQFTYHPETLNEGKYIKLTWSGGDFFSLDELYEAYETEQEAIDAATPTVDFSWSSQLW